MARVFDHYRQQIGSGLDTKRNGARFNPKRVPSEKPVRASHSGGRSGHFERTRLNIHPTEPMKKNSQNERKMTNNPNISKNL